MLQLRNNPTVPKFNKGIFKELLPHVTTSIKKGLQRMNDRIFEILWHPLQYLDEEFS